MFFYFIFYLRLVCHLFLYEMKSPSIFKPTFIYVTINKLSSFFFKVNVIIIKLHYFKGNFKNVLPNDNVKLTKSSKLDKACVARF